MDLEKLSGKYEIEIFNEPFVNVEKHTKTQKKEKNRTYDKNIISIFEQQFIDKNKNANIENHINRTTMSCYKHYI